MKQCDQRTIKRTIKGGWWQTIENSH
jgi:hypothetical protein